MPLHPLDPLGARVLRAMLGMQRQSWEQGVAAHALLDLGLRDDAAVLARDAVTRQTPDGRLGDLQDTGTVNGAANGEAVLVLARDRDDAGLRAALDRQLAWLLHGCPRTPDGTLVHLAGTEQVWVDTVYMVVPLLVQTGHVEAALAQLRGHRQRLVDPHTGLYAHVWDERTGRLQRAALWGTGSGWVAAGLARALRHLPADGPHAAVREELAAHVRALVDACLPYRTDAGLFHDVLDDPASFEEGNLVQMLAFTTLAGSADGWLPVSYGGLGRELLATARTLVDADGFVTPVCGAPHFDRPGTSVEAQAFHLLATAAGRH